MLCDIFIYLIFIFWEDPPCMNLMQHGSQYLVCDRYNSWSKADELVVANDFAYMPIINSKKPDDPSQDWRVHLKVVNVWMRDDQKTLMEGEVDRSCMILLGLHP